MLSPADRRIAARLKKLLEPITPILKFVVFGSRARGDAGPDSDLDVFILVPVVNQVLRERIRLAAWEVAFNKGLVISTLVATPAEIQGIFGVAPIYRSIEMDGVAV